MSLIKCKSSSFNKNKIKSVLESEIEKIIKIKPELDLKLIKHPEYWYLLNVVSNDLSENINCKLFQKLRIETGSDAKVKISTKSIFFSPYYIGKYFGDTNIRVKIMEIDISVSGEVISRKINF